ncbi:Hypothetical predicted protein [Mytilus galloprovincialis]|uniref:Uncharacterized protein n=1 Tax=Mytilus galloprovincialis TaxID=29158 RepID=A0A8B6GGT1_MYTGA|nr:Hypothetical predicted protein [Mytilus galloprovincialis]
MCTRIAFDLQDTVLLAKLSAGDMMSQESIYHVECLTHLYNRARPLKVSDDSSENGIHGIVLAELIVYIEESRKDWDVIPIFKLADLTRMFTSRIKQFGLNTYATTKNYDDEALLLSKVAQIVRKDMIAMQYILNGTFETGCQQNSVPQLFKTLVGMILGGLIMWIPKLKQMTLKTWNIPGQIPVITCAQPPYALVISAQRNWPNRFSEEHILILFGSLHIEIAALRTIGDWLDNTGVTSALSQANIASSGTADSFFESVPCLQNTTRPRSCKCTVHSYATIILDVYGRKQP